MGASRTAVAVLAALLFLYTEEIFADPHAPARETTRPLPGISPSLCIGFREDARGGYFSSFGEDANCPEGHAAYSVSLKSDSIFSSAKNITVLVSCCPLPAPDILLAEHSYEAERCPEDFVATGGSWAPPCEGCDAKIRCTRINTERYRLGPKTRGAYWGLSSTYYQEPRRYMKLDIPAAIRYGFSRLSMTSWLYAGCTGEPFASLFVEKSGRRCGEQFFRELQFRGLPGDPPEGTPVPMYPECADISNVFSPNPECVR